MSRKLKKPEKRSWFSSLFFQYMRFTVSLVLVSIILILGISTAFISSKWSGDRRELLTDNVTDIAKQVEMTAASDFSKNESETALVLTANMLAFMSKSSDADIFIANTDGTVKLCGEKLAITDEEIGKRSCNIHDNLKLPDDLLVESEDGILDAVENLGGPYNNRIQTVVRADIVSGGEVQGYVFAISPAYSGMDDYVKGLVAIIAVAAVITLLIAVIISYFFAYNMTKPLKQMIYLTNQYSKGDFSERITVKGNDELMDLAESLNSMAQTLSELESSRKSFVANVSHELKTPMTTIGGFVDGILDGTIPPELQSKYLKTVSNEIKRLTRLVITMLTLSKIEAGEEKLNYTEVDLNQLLFEALICFEKSIDEAGYHIEGFEDLPEITILADRDMLFQVLYNLFDNAVKFTDKGGTIKIEIDDFSTQTTVKISNTGLGIPEDEVHRIFERFYKVDKSRSEHVKGVGLGLGLARNIIWLHGGEIYARSRQYGITTMSFWIPKNPPEAKQE